MKKSHLITCITTLGLVSVPLTVSFAESDQPSKIRQLLDSITEYTGPAQTEPRPDENPEDSRVKDVLRDIEEFERDERKDPPKNLFSKPNFALDEESMSVEDEQHPSSPLEGTEESNKDTKTYIAPEEYLKDDQAPTEQAPSFTEFPDPVPLEGYPIQPDVELRDEEIDTSKPPLTSPEELAKQREKLGNMLGEIEKISSTDVREQNPSKPAASQEWPIVVIRIINKITSKRTLVEAPVHQTTVFEDTLKVTPRRCIQSLPEDPQESTAFLEVKKTMPQEDEKSIFGGWMIASKPGVSGLEDPTYDVVVVTCKKPKAATEEKVTAEQTEKKP